VDSGGDDDSGDDSDATMDLEGSLERDDGVRGDSEGDSGGGGASGASAASAVSTAVPMRPACRHYDPAEPVVFMLLDSTHDDATITMYGVTARGESVIVVVEGFRPYFYVRAPADSDESEFAAELARKIGKGAAAVERVERVQSRSIMHYTTATRDYYRITVAKPQLVGPAVKALDADQGDWEHTLEASESKPAKYEERFFIDAGITGGGWVSCEGGRWTDAGAGDAQLCLDVSWDVAAPPLKSAGSGAEYQRLCPLRVLSMDILSDGALRQLHQPQAQATNLLGLSIVLDPGVDGVDIYKTALIVVPEKYKKGSGSLGVHAGMSLEYVRSETEMLTRFEELVVQLDPDFISGTDVGHSMQLLQFKAELLKLDSWGAGFGRGGALKVKKKQTYNPKWVKAAGRQSATSNQEGKEISSSGRIFIDVREAAQAQRNLRTYAFTEITEALLSGERAAWFSGATISQKLLRGFREQSDADICEVVRYSQKLADQARRCVAAMQVITEATTLARVTGQPLKSVWTRGKMLQAVNMLLRAARTRGFLVPDMGTPRDATATEAPLTYQPDARLHENPICVLDFASLYPSVIIGYNMSYDTLLTAAAQKSATAPQHEVVHLTSGGSDRDFGYVTADTHKGVVPEILENLLAERKEVKALLRDETDDSMRVILDLRQKSIKVAANAFYGFLGAQSSRLRCLPIAECTLGLGRAMLEHAKHLIEADDGRDTPDLPRTRSRVIYGDTDSVFVSYTGASLSVGQAARKARAQAEMVTRRIGRRPIELEYEKTYRRFVIQQIKRYAGAVVTEGFHGGDENEMDCDIKGFESQMRDTPAYIARAVRSVLVALTVGGGPAAARAAALAAIHEVLGRRHHLLDLSHTRALKMWESASHASPAKTKKKRAAGEAEKDKTKLYDVTTAHVALATKIEQQYGGRVSFESGQRVSYVFCAPPAAAAQRASTGQKKLPLFQLATDPFEALAQGRSVDWDEALRQLCMPLQRIFCLRGVLGGDNGRGGGGGGSAPRDWESLLKIAEQEFDATARAAPWKQTHTSGGGGGGGGGGSSGSSDGKKAAKGTLGAFFKVKASSSCVICNRPGGTDGVCGRGECAQRVGTVRAELQQQVADAQMTQRVCLAEWRQCLGCEPTQWRIRAGGSSNAAAAAAAEGAGRRGKLLLGCENEYVDVPFRMELAVQAESRANQRLQRLGGGGGGAGL
jgi:DNA polymerase delta subunit 1